MSEIGSKKSYWAEFSKFLETDQTDIKSHTSKEPTIRKIINFSCNPWSISENINQYPFSQKENELSTISDAEIDYLFNMRLEQTGRLRVWFDFFCRRFLLVENTVKSWAYLNEFNNKSEKPIPKRVINESIKELFDNCLSIDRTIKYKERKGIKRTIRERGVFYPVRILKFIEEHDIKNKNIDLEYQEHFFIQPSKQQIIKHIDELDIDSVLLAQKHTGSMYDSLLFGDLLKKDITQSLEGQDEKEKLSLIRPVVSFLYDGEPLTNPFVFSVFNRMVPLIKKVVTKTYKSHGGYTGTKEELRQIAAIKLWNLIQKYDESKGVYPRGWFNNYFKRYFSLEVFESQPLSKESSFTMRKISMTDW